MSVHLLQQWQHLMTLRIPDSDSDFDSDFDWTCSLRVPSVLWYWRRSYQDVSSKINYDTYEGKYAVEIYSR